jgi:signal peptidase II
LKRFASAPWLWAPAVLLADFLSKRLVLAHSEALQARVEVLGTLLRFAYVRNPGAAMGLFPATRLFLIVISALASLFLLDLYRRTPLARRVRRAATAAILGGALGNLIDRIFYNGLVVDFIDIGIGPHRFYTFNVADMGVTLGGAVLFLSLLVEARHRPDHAHQAGGTDDGGGAAVADPGDQAGQDNRPDGNREGERSAPSEGADQP